MVVYCVLWLKKYIDGNSLVPAACPPTPPQTAVAQLYCPALWPLLLPLSRSLKHTHTHRQLNYLSCWSFSCIQLCRSPGSFQKKLKSISERRHSKFWNYYCTYCCDKGLEILAVILSLAFVSSPISVSDTAVGCLLQSWALSVFYLFNKEIDFAFFIKLLPISAPVLFKKPTLSQINLIKNAKISFFII